MILMMMMRIIMVMCRYGVRDTHCNGASWSHEENLPICTSKSPTSYLD